MEILVSGTDLDHANVFGQVGVQSRCPSPQRQSIVIHIDMGALCLGVNA
jgi:hypothetical protein